MLVGIVSKLLACRAWSIHASKRNTSCGTTAKKTVVRRRHTDLFLDEILERKQTKVPHGRFSLERMIRSSLHTHGDY